MDYTLIDFEEVKKLLDDLGWEYDRMSSSGQETIDKLFKMFGIITNDTNERIFNKIQDM